MENLIMIFTEGFEFVGKREKNTLKDAIKLISINLQDNKGQIMPTNIPVKVGDIQFGDLSRHPFIKVDENSELFKQYILVTTNLTIPGKKIH